MEASIDDTRSLARDDGCNPQIGKSAIWRSTMKPSIGYLASFLSATAIVAPVGLAPVAIAATNSSGASQSAWQNAAPVKPGKGAGGQAVPLKAAPAAHDALPGHSTPPPYGVGVDPLVLTDTGANPLVLLPQGDGLAF